VVSTLRDHNYNSIYHIDHDKPIDYVYIHKILIRSSGIHDLNEDEKVYLFSEAYEFGLVYYFLIQINRVQVESIIDLE